MDEGFLVATQLSSLLPSQVISISVQTARSDIPLPQSKEDPFAEHAAFSLVLDTPATGTIVLRLLHGGLIVELLSFSTQVPPIRIVFPSAILNSPGLFLWENDELHLLAVSATGSLYRVVIPISGNALWHDHIDNIWPREYLMKNFGGEMRNSLVHAHGIHCVILGMANGCLLRLEAEAPGYDGSNEEWSETFFQHGSFLSSLTSFLPSIGAIPSGSDVISISSLPWPTDVGHIWTLSRDRTLRFWKAKLGCIASKTLSSISSGGDSSHSAGTGNPTRHHPLLDAAPQTLLKAFTISHHEERIYLLVFLPTVSSSRSGGAFRIIDTSGDQLQEKGTIECSKNTAQCHLQDFAVVNGTIYALWDREGHSVVEKTHLTVEDVLASDFGSKFWRAACYSHEPELTPAHMEEKLLSLGSLTEQFYEAVMRPGVFSTLTLRTAIDQYMDACLSLPGPIPSALTSSYATLTETIAAVVGCTVSLNRDTQTGAFQYANYWMALKRDWEGFVARCREVERSARRPLVLGSYNQNDILVIERERVGFLAKEDLPIHIRRLITRELQIDEQYSLLGILRFLRSKLGPETMVNVEKSVMDIIRQETAFSLVDILQDQARRLNFMSNIDEGCISWVSGRLQSIGELDTAVRTALDVVGGFDVEVKSEDDDSRLLDVHPQSDLLCGLTTAYIHASIEARYDLSLSLITLLFFVADELSTWDQSLLAEVLAVFRGAAMLLHVAEQPAGETNKLVSAPGAAVTPDDVISQMRNMHVSQNKISTNPKLSLMHLLLANSASVFGLPAAAHRFMDSTGVLQSVSPAHATKHEVLFCEGLRLLGFHDMSMQLLSCLPRTHGVIYVLAQVWMDTGRPDDASPLLEKLAGCFGPDAAVTNEDQEALASVLPGAQAIDSEFSFYVFCSSLSKSKSWVNLEIHFAKRAMSVAPPDSDTSSLCQCVIKGLADLGYYDDAYATLMSSPYEKLKRELASHLAVRMCEENAVEKLIELDFAGIANEVESALSFKARNVDPRILPSFSKILYTWYIRRGDYRNAALVMYQHARKIQDVVLNPTTFSLLVDEQLEALNVAINALSLVDPKISWVLLPVSVAPSHQSHKWQKLSRHIPEVKYTSGTFDTEIVHLKDMQHDYALLLAQVAIIRRDPDILSSPEFLLPADLVILRMTQANLFNMAMSTARSLDVDMTDVFTRLTHQCLRLSRNPDAVLQEDTSDWLLTDKVSSWPGSPADRGWRYLRQSLERYDGVETDHRYCKASLNTILSVGGNPPPWLVDMLQNHHPEYLIRTSLQYENINEAVAYTLSLVRRSDTKLARTPTKNASMTWLPYALIDQVLFAASSQESPPTALSELRTEVTNRANRVERQSQTMLR